MNAKTWFSWTSQPSYTFQQWLISLGAKYRGRHVAVAQLELDRSSIERLIQIASPGVSIFLITPGPERGFVNDQQEVINHEHMEIMG